ncbi:MAG: formamidopyrimidine-DNA glycosylase [Candidatus Brocadiae bacterium]|nr:formamidopyrimidine-DNA glycosylase [Candidatus Brocadiia bacterium]
MPELPDLEIYREHIARLCRGRILRSVRVASPFLLRTVTPPLSDFHGRTLATVGRLGKRLLLGFEPQRCLAIHLMISGRLRWLPPDSPLPRRLGLAAFDFDHGSLVLTEAGTKRRAALHALDGPDGLAALDRGGIDPLAATADAFLAALRRESRTLKRALTDPGILSGIGNAYSDEILHRAGLSPVQLTGRLTDAQGARLRESTIAVLTEWTATLRKAAGDSFPGKVTAFRKGMAVHGRYREPCPVCSAPVQRIVHGEHETNYCPRCQNGGRILADRSLSRLLKGDWPRTLEELEESRPGGAGSPSGAAGPSRPPRRGV